MGMEGEDRSCQDEVPALRTQQNIQIVGSEFHVPTSHLHVKFCVSSAQGESEAHRYLLMRLKVGVILMKVRVSLLVRA